MIIELDKLLWLGMALIIFVPMMYQLLQLQRRIVGYSSNLKHIDITPLLRLWPHKEQSELFRTIYESVPECIILQKHDGAIELINQAGLRLLETRKSSSIVSQSIYELIVEEYQHAYQAMTDSVFLGNKACLEYEVMTLQGNRRWMRTNAVPLRNSKQQIISLIAITHDITENKLALEQLESHRNKLQTIIESEPECLNLQDAEGKIIDMNPAGLSILNAEKRGDVIGKSIYDFMMPEYTQEYSDLTAAVFNGDSVSMEFEVVNLKGSQRWLETHAVPLFDNERNVSALLAITRDIGDRKQNEARLYQQQTELARVCRLSTVGEMASSLAHELNQPLCAISSYAESANWMNIPANSELDELLGKIVQQSQRATKIIKNMKDFVRKQTPRPESISASSIIKNVIDFVELDRRRNMIHLNLQIADDLSPVKADRVQIEQVLLNLITNAIQAVQELEEDQRIITIKVLREFNDEVMFMVCDTGPDISEDIIKKLFTPFYTTKVTGMGMGLSISRSIVEAHGGHIWYKMKPEDGACFCFTLPAADYD